MTLYSSWVDIHVGTAYYQWHCPHGCYCRLLLAREKWIHAHLARFKLSSCRRVDRIFVVKCRDCFQSVRVFPLSLNMNMNMNMNMNVSFAKTTKWMNSSSSNVLMDRSTVLSFLILIYWLTLTLLIIALIWLYVCVFYACVCVCVYVLQAGPTVEINRNRPGASTTSSW